MGQRCSEKTMGMASRIQIVGNSERRVNGWRLTGANGPYPGEPGSRMKRGGSITRVRKRAEVRFLTGGGGGKFERGVLSASRQTRSLDQPVRTFAK